MTDPRTAPPLLRVMRGDASPEELAALVAVVATRAAIADVQASSARTSRWGTPRLRGAPLRAGTGAWVASAGPALR